MKKRLIVKILFAVSVILALMVSMVANVFAADNDTFSRVQYKTYYPGGTTNLFWQAKLYTFSNAYLKFDDSFTPAFISQVGYDIFINDASSGNDKLILTFITENPVVVAGDLWTGTDGLLSVYSASDTASNVSGRCYVSVYYFYKSGDSWSVSFSALADLQDFSHKVPVKLDTDNDFLPSGANGFRLYDIYGAYADGYSLTDSPQYFTFLSDPSTYVRDLLYLQGLNGDDSSYESGYNAGYTAGKEDGYDLGYLAGTEYGRDLGYDLGKSEGYESGYSVGKEDGYNLGVSASSGDYSQGYADGRASAYEEYNAVAGLLDGTVNTLSSTVGFFFKNIKVGTVTLGAVVSLVVIFVVVTFIIKKVK